MNTRTIFLHVGMQKTASSSIQQTLHNNKNILCKNSYLYPSSWSAWHVKEFGDMFPDETEESRRNIFHNRNKLTTFEKKNLQNHTIEKLYQEVIDKKLDNLILSAESLVLFSHKTIFKLNQLLSKKFNTTNIRIILYVKEKNQFMNSIVQQYIKSAIDFNIEDVIAKYNSCYYDSIYKFYKVFGKKNVTVLKFEETCQDDFGPVGFFLKTIGLDTNSISSIDYKRTNASISINAADLIYFINRQSPLIVDNEISKYRKRDDMNIFFDIPGPKYSLKENMQLKILKESKKDIEWLEKTVGIKYENTLLNREDIDFDNKFCIYIQKVFFSLTKHIQNIVQYYVEKNITNECMKNLLKWIKMNKIRDKKYEAI